MIRPPTVDHQMGGKTLEVLMSVEHYASLFDRVLEEFNGFLIFSKAFSRLTLLVQWCATNNRETTKLGPYHFQSLLLWMEFTYVVLTGDFRN